MAVLPEGAIRVHNAPRLYVLGEPFVEHATQAMQAGDEEWAKLFNACIERFRAHQHVEHAILHTANRGVAGPMGDPEGWLEFLLVITYETGGRMTIGCIQRIPGGSFEFHS